MRVCASVHVCVTTPLFLEALVKQCERENIGDRHHILLHLKALVKILLVSIGRLGQVSGELAGLFDLQRSQLQHYMQNTFYIEHILLRSHFIKRPTTQPTSLYIYTEHIL